MGGIAVSRWAGIVVGRLLQGERAKLLRLDEILLERIAGKDEAVQLVADIVIPRRPHGPKDKPVRGKPFTARYSV